MATVASTAGRLAVAHADVLAMQIQASCQVHVIESQGLQHDSQDCQQV